MPSAEALKQIYKFDTWPGVDAPAKFLHFWIYRPEMRAWPDIVGIGTDEALTMSGALVSRAYQVKMTARRIVTVSVGEHVDGIRARETLLEILGSSMAGRMPRGEDRGIGLGEISYASHVAPLTWVGFVRGNLVVEVQSDGDEEIAVDGFARGIAEQVERRHDATPDGPRIDSLMLGGTRAARGARVPLRFDFADRPDGRLTVRLETTAGPFSREPDGRMWVQALRSGPHQVVLTIESADGRVGQRVVALEVGP